MKKIKIIYLISTGLFSLLMLMSAGMYVFNNQEISNTFVNLGYPSYIIYPLALLKVLGLVAIWVLKNRTLKEWAYAGFFFNVVLAFFAHVMINDGEFPGALIAFVLLATSYFANKKLEK